MIIGTLCTRISRSLRGRYRTPAEAYGSLVTNSEIHTDPEAGHSCKPRRSDDADWYYGVGSLGIFIQASEGLFRLAVAERYVSVPGPLIS